MKKTVLGIALFSFVFLGSVPAVHADSKGRDSEMQKEELVLKVKALQAQLDELRNIQQKGKVLKEDIKDSRYEIRSDIKEMKLGSSGDDVKFLQALLASDGSVYPEGLITGKYGPLTEKAIKKFQKKNGIKETGKVDSETAKRLNKRLDDYPLSMEKRNGENRPCAIVPPGHLIAPGYLKKTGATTTPIILECQDLPYGIAKKLGIATTSPGKGTTTKDYIAPIISNLSATSTKATSTIITWKTNEVGTSKVWYSTTTPVIGGANTKLAFSPLFTFEHNIPLLDLSTSTTYYFIVGSYDVFGNTATSSQMTFTTLAN